MNTAIRPPYPAEADPQGDDLLVLAAAGDAAQLAAMRARHAHGEPAPYIAGFIQFRGRRFRMDSRAYITDPELVGLVDIVASEGRALEERLGRPLRVLEFGVGAGTLALTVKLDHPHWTAMGIDIDAQALALAAQNAREHGVEIALLRSNYFSQWPVSAPPPDLIFGDPPWGGPTDLYAPTRTADYYRRMPPHSAFSPTGAGCAVHDSIIAGVRKLGWPSLLVLNYGVLSRDVVLASVAKLREHHLVAPQPHLIVAVGRVL